MEQQQHFEDAKNSIRENNLDALKKIVKDGFDIHYDFDELMHFASEINNTKIIKYLVKQGVDVNMPFMMAVYKNNYKLVQYLIEHGADEDINNDDALEFAFKHNKHKMVKYLIEHGADPNIYNGGLLLYNLERENFEMIKFLVEHGADVNINNGVVFKSAIKGDLDIADYLLKNGVDININNGKLLASRVARGKFNIVKYLVENKIIIDELSLQIAAYSNRNDIAEYLIENGANINDLLLDNTTFMTYDKFNIKNPENFDGIEVNEKKIGETCFDLIMHGDEPINDLLEEKETFIFVIINTSQNDYDTLCYTKKLLKSIVNNRVDSVSYECTGNLIEGTNDKSMNSFDKKNPYIQLPANKEGLLASVPYTQVSDLLRSNHRVFYLVPRINENGVQIMLTHTSSYKNVLGSNPDYTSSNHCQGGSAALVYDIKKCVGDCIISSKFGNI